MSMPQEYLFEIPGAPRGQARARATAFKIKTADGREKWVGRVHKDKKQQLEEDKLGWQIANGAPKKPHTGRISLYVVAYYPIAKSWSKKKQADALSGRLVPVNVKPDLSNIVKHVEDVMQGLFYVDDKQICALSATKHYSESPRVKIALLCEDAED